ncbi:hypothetical protein AAA074_07105 [Coprococcus comes]|uniref:hypothetical protein n=1 Tax=Coprococcus comes TaxID=410072 RepID=UPI0032BF6725
MEEQNGSPFPLLRTLGIIFIVLKLCGVITWSWIWVLCPFWCQFLLSIIVLLICYIVRWREERYWKNLKPKND